MGQKCLIVYASRTGNTEKVALRFKSTFEKHRWECDSFKIDQKMVKSQLPFDFKEYDFVCVGSGVELHEPYHEIIACLRIPRYGFDPQSAMSEPSEQRPIERSREGGRPMMHHRIIFGPESEKAVVFVTYSGYDLGPKEAEPAMALMALEVEHLEFQCIGRFSCPGKFINEPTPETYYGDIRDRPNERDLLKAEIFIEEKLEEIRDRTV